HFLRQCMMRRRVLHSFPTRRSSDLSIYWPGYSEELSAALDKEIEHLYATPSLLFNIALGVCAILSVIGIIGLFLFKPWGRSLSLDRKSTRLNSSHVKITYAVF